MNRALMVIDVQNEYFTGRLKVCHPRGSFENILKAMDAATAKNLPVIVVQHTALTPDSPVFRKDTPEWALHPEVGARPHDLLLHKNLPGSFTGTPLDDFLKARDIETLVIAGYMTQMCCDTTARQAFHRGYKVVFLSDATGTLDFENTAGAVTAAELHRTVLVTQQARFSTVMSTDQWIAGLKRPY